MNHPYDLDDVRSAALCAWREARGQGTTGMHAVLHVLKNRVGTPGFASTLHNVIYGKNQFSSMSVVSDPEFNLDPATTSAYEQMLYNEALRLANVVLNSNDADPTKHPITGNPAHYYANLATATSGWFQRVIVEDEVNHPMTVKIMEHTFFV